MRASALSAWGSGWVQGTAGFRRVELVSLHFPQRARLDVHLGPGISYFIFTIASQFPLPEPNVFGTCDNWSVFLLRKGNGLERSLLN